MKTELKKLKVKFEGKTIEIDIQKELSINENIINSLLGSFHLFEDYIFEDSYSIAD